MPSLESCPCEGIHLPRFVQPVLLALLANAPMHGYVLMQKLSDLGLFDGGSPDMTGMYRKLREMERMGVLSIVRETSSSGPARKIYALTDDGRECLHKWLSSLKKNRGHLDSVIALLAKTAAAHPAPETPCCCGSGARPQPVQLAPFRKSDAASPAVLTACSQSDREFISSVRRRAMAGAPARREDLLRLLSFDPASPACAELGRQAREMADEITGGTASVWAAVGVDCVPCSMNCRFCAFGEKWGVVRKPHEWSESEILSAVKHFVAEGAGWIILRTTEHYGEERLRVLLRKVRAIVPPGCFLVANTSQLSLEAFRELRACGVEGTYHALRLREGLDTPFQPDVRRRALDRITEAGLLLAHLVEPLGVEHSNEEIADAFLAAQSAGACVCGVMARVNVPGTPFADFPQVPDARLAQVAAVTRLCGGPRIPYICVHPPVPQAVAWGANVVVVETGAVPRDDVEAGHEWKEFTIQEAKKLLASQGWRVTDRLY